MDIEYPMTDEEFQKYKKETSMFSEKQKANPTIYLNINECNPKDYFIRTFALKY